MNKLAMAYAMKNRQKKMCNGGAYADGGMVEEEKASGEEEHEDPAPEANESADLEDADMIERIMKKRGYSKGGMVANDVGIAEADKLPAEYDDLVLRDDLESSYDADNSGDKLGNAAMDERDEDMVSRIMRSRAKKDKLPRPA